MGRNSVKKNRVKEILDSVFFHTISPPCPWLCFFSEHLNWLVLSITRLQLLSTRVLETHLGGLKAACIGSALSKFRLSVVDGSTYCPRQFFDSGAQSQAQPDIQVQPVQYIWRCKSTPKPIQSISHNVTRTSQDRKWLPWVHLIRCQGFPLHLLSGHCTYIGTFLKCTYLAPITGGFLKMHLSSVATIPAWIWVDPQIRVFRSIYLHNTRIFYKTLHNTRIFTNKSPIIENKYLNHLFWYIISLE